MKAYAIKQATKLFARTISNQESSEQQVSVQVLNFLLDFIVAPMNKTWWKP